MSGDRRHFTRVARSSSTACVSRRVGSCRQHNGVNNEILLHTRFDTQTVGDSMTPY